MTSDSACIKSTARPCSFAWHTAQRVFIFGARASLKILCFWQSSHEKFGYFCAETMHIPHGARSMEGARGVLSLLQQLGEGYGLLCMYKCQVCAPCSRPDLPSAGAKPFLGRVSVHCHVQMLSCSPELNRIH